MLRFIVKRVLWMIPVLLGVTLLVFTISYFMPGDVVWNIVGSNASQEAHDAMVVRLGLDQPFFKQYWNYISGIITRFDFGTSYVYKHSVGQEILARLPYTLRLGFLGMLLSIIIGLSVGIISATKQYSFSDYSLTVISMFFASMPGFWFALMLILLFSVSLGWLPATGVATWKNWVLPVIASGITSCAVIMRMTRSSMLEVIRQDYIRTARSKGLKESTVIRKHALRNSLIPVITVIGMHFSIIMGGSVIIETIFNIPGMGMYLMAGINNRDYPIILGCVLVISFWTCLMNLLVDLCYAYIDPRIKAQYQNQGKPRRRKHSTEKEVA